MLRVPNSWDCQAQAANEHHADTRYIDANSNEWLTPQTIRKCGFVEYECWVMTNFLFSTGVRQRSLNHIQIKDVDLDNYVVYVKVTKNRKPLVIPINSNVFGITNEQYKLVSSLMEMNRWNQFDQGQLEWIYRTSKKYGSSLEEVFEFFGWFGGYLAKDTLGSNSCTCVYCLDINRPSCRSFDFLNSTTGGFFISLSIFLQAVQG